MRIYCAHSVRSDAHRSAGEGKHRRLAKKYRDVKRALRRAGWSRQRDARGSHEVWVAPDGRKITLATGGKDNREVPAGTLASIGRRTGLKELH
jgi:predicted RNA binding protein YcfA (HicA-like mRNA interferase family)